MADNNLKILVETIYSSTGIRLTEADLNKFLYSLDQTSKGVESSTSAMGAAVNAARENLGQLQEVLGIGASLGGLVELARSEGEVVERTHRLSEVMGVSIEETSRLSFAAEQATGSSDSLAQASFFLSNAMREVQAGTGPAADAINKMGIDPNGIKGIPDLLQKMGDFIKTSTLPQFEKLALAHEVLGRGAAQLYPLLAKGGEGMRDLANQADAAGRVINDSTVESVKQFNLQFATLQNQLRTGIGLTIIKLAVEHPDFVKLAGEIALTGAALKLLEGLGVVGLFKAMIATVGRLNTEQHAAATAAIEEAAANEKAAASVAKLAGVTGIALQTVKAETAAIIQRNLAQLEGTKVAEAETRAMGVLNVTTAEAAAAAKQSTTAFSGAAAKAGVIAGAILDVVEIIKVGIVGLQTLKALLHAHQSSEDTATAVDATMAKLQKYGDVTIKTFAQVKQLTAEQATAYRHDLTGALSLATIAIEKYAKTGGESLANAQASVKNLREALTDLGDIGVRQPPTPAKPAFQTSDANTNISGQEADLERAKALLAAHDATRANAVRSGAKDAESAEREHAAEMAKIFEAEAQVALEKRNRTDQDAVSAGREAAAAVGTDKEEETRKKYDDAVAAAQKAQADLSNVYIKGDQERAESNKRVQEARAADLKTAQDLERKDHEAHLQSIVQNEKKSVAERIAAIRALAEEKKKTLTTGEKELLDVQTNKEISSLVKKEDHADRGPNIQGDALSKVGITIGGAAPVHQASEGKRTNDLLTEIIRNGVTIKNPTHVKQGARLE